MPTEISYDREHTDEAVKQRGEVFTPTPLVNEMLDKLPVEVFADKTKTFLDNSCGNGQFLSAVLERKMANGSTQEEALKTIYGVDIDETNVNECRERLLMGHNELRAIVEKNIVCANALDPNHSGWAQVGYMWSGRRQMTINDFLEIEPAYARLKGSRIHQNRNRTKLNVGNILINAEENMLIRVMSVIRSKVKCDRLNSERDESFYMPRSVQLRENVILFA